MQPYRTEAIVNAEGQIVLTLPFRTGEKVDVVVIPADEMLDEAAWKELAAQEFLAGYSDKDAAYDQYAV